MTPYIQDYSQKRQVLQVTYAQGAGDPPHFAELSTLDDAAFRARFSGSSIERIGRGRFVRNVLVAIGNSGEPALLPHAERLRGDADPVVSETAIWASERLESPACGQLRRDGPH